MACDAAGESASLSSLTKYFGAIFLAITIPASPQTEAADAMAHVKKACEVVWQRGTFYQIERCTKRAMAALGDENRLRDNELKRLLIQADKELDTCKDALEKFHNPLPEQRTKTKNRRVR